MKRLLRISTLLLIFFLNYPNPSSAQTFTGTPAKEWINTIVERFQLSGYAQGGYEYYDQSTTEDQFKISRIIFMANAKVSDHINAFMMYDFKSSSLHELWFNYQFCKALSVKVGQFKTPFSIENPLSPTVLELIYPGSLVTGYMIGGSSDLMMKGGSGRDIGLNINGELLKGWVTYDLALMNGAGRNQNDNNAQKDFVGRVGLHPTKWLTLSGSILKGTGNIAVYQNQTGETVSDLAPIGGLKHNGNYRRDRYAAGLEMKTTPFNLRSEYMAGKDGSKKSKGFYATGSVNNIGIKHLDLVASYDYLDIWSGKTNRYSAGLQYWFYPRCRLQVGYGYNQTDGKKNENCILTQIQVRF